MRNNPELLKELLNKIKNTPECIIEKAIDILAEKILIEDTMYNPILYINNDFEIESESKQWMEELVQAA